MNARQNFPSAAGAGTRDWAEDREYLLLGTAIWVLGYAYPTLPPFGLSYRAMWMPLIAGAMWIVVRRFPLGSALLQQVNAGMLLVLLWAFCSALWAPDAVYVLTQGLSITGISVVALAFSLAAWQPHRFESLLTRVTTILLVASLLAVLLFPALAIHHGEEFELAGSWRGVAYQKNGLGQLAAIGLIVWTYRWAVGKTRAWRAALGVGLSLLLLVKSRSSTSLLLSVIACGVLLLQLRPPIRVGNGGTVLAAVFIIVAPVLGFIELMVVGGDGSLAEAFGSVFGKDATFSGRTFIWAEMMDEIRRHPLMGSGFSSFWGHDDTRSAAAQEIVLKLGWPVPNGHNGYIDMANELGLIGLGLFLVFLAIHIRDLARLGRIDPRPAALHRCLLIFILLANLSETGWFHPITMTHVLAMYSSVEVSRLLFEQRLRARFRESQSVESGIGLAKQTLHNTLPARPGQST